MDGAFRTEGDIVNESACEIAIHGFIMKWLKSSINAVSVDFSPTIHVDDLVGQRSVSPSIIDMSLKIYRALVIELMNMDDPCQPILVIPLVDSRELFSIAIPKDVSSISRQWNHIEPPSLYLCDWELAKYAVIDERYQMPIYAVPVLKDVPRTLMKFIAAKSWNACGDDDDYRRYINAYYYSSELWRFGER